MRSLFLGTSFVALFAASALAQSATIEPVQGDLSLNQGQGFQRVDARVQANVGDSVMVGPGGSANLIYPDGCQVNVQPGSVVNIAPLSPCASGSFAAELPIPPPPPSGAPEGYPPPSGAPEGYGTLIAGAVAVVAIGVGIAASLAVRHVKPASP